MKYANKRMVFRTGGGRFRKPVPADLGIMGVCPKCGHLLLRHYDGDPTEPFPDPRKFHARCFSCEPVPIQAEAPQDVKGFFNEEIK